MDPVAPSLADGGDFNRYAYARNNPYRYTDSTGQYVETAWDVVNVAIGVRSFGANVAEGNWGAAALDAVGVLVDGLAVAAPFPGGVGTAIHMARAADAVVDAAETARQLESAADSAGGLARTVTISSERFPLTAQHISDAQAAGQPALLTIDRSGATSNRRDALQGTSPLPGQDRDEYPPAMFREGGAGASVRGVPPGDNRGAGSCIGAQCRDLPDGAKVRIEVEREKPR
jgi:hypothetical protein